MRRPTARLEAFEKERMRRRPPDYLRNLRLYEALYEEARTLGVLPAGDPLEAAAVDIRRTHAFHVRDAAGPDRHDA